ncbi:hypothetical protein [Asticcacaulis sp. EMRT-3]|uniref:hypothetical protein n=1 Tax=Asticcacaulis sp. EMRT-3 TaxID=3040349 RepID=UPI0024AF2955|nr:hypothetical protein [Asticcacaulis sp. EMRT-3]MDI7776581.1 hypothetical protein [Asticcacaulis sp. EMRT-3]
MSNSSNAPTAPKTLQLDGLLDDFEPRIKPAALATPNTPRSRPVQKETVFPSREPKGPKHVQVNCYLRSEVGERFRAFLKRDEYTTWTYAQAIEFLMDYHDRNVKKTGK